MSRLTVAPVHCPPGSKRSGNGCIDRHPVTIRGGDAHAQSDKPLAIAARKSIRVTSAACTARRGLRFYTSRWLFWRGKMGAGASRTSRAVIPTSCPLYLAQIRRTKAHAARLAYYRWFKDEWNWQAWLPDKFARVGACETGYGKRPGSWTWDSGTYVSAFGIYRPAYEAYHRWTGHNSPREQYEVAAAIQRRFGWSAWGCGGA